MTLLNEVVSGTALTILKRALHQIVRELGETILAKHTVVAGLYDSVTRVDFALDTYRLVHLNHILL
jgi:hypothetical protein